MQTAIDSLDYDFLDTAFGRCLLARSRRGICALRFVDGGERRALAELQREWPGHRMRRAPLAALVRAAIDDPAAPRPPLDLRGTAFQRRVWQALLALPPGATTSYRELARRVGRPGAARAVGNAVGRNPVGLLVPCHRVVRSDGAAGGYRWGAARKRALLAWERDRARGQPHLG